MSEYERYNRKRGYTFIFICFCVSLGIPCLFIHQWFILNSLKGELYQMQMPNSMIFYFTENILALTALIRVVKVSMILDGLYFITLLCYFPLERTIYNLKRFRNEKIWVKRIYIVMFIFVCVISIFVVFVNLQYYSKVILKVYPLIYCMFCAVPCHILGLCFCVLIWSKFFDDVLLFGRFIMSKIKKYFNST
jgi:hypothetical protein